MTASISVLSKRESEIFYKLTDGKPNRVIGKELFISPRTVETHKARIFKKLGLTNVVELVKYALREKLISL